MSDYNYVEPMDYLRALPADERKKMLDQFVQVCETWAAENGEEDDLTIFMRSGIAFYVQIGWL